MKLFKLLLFLFLTSQYGCNINSDGEVTIKVPEKGENSFVCYINGKKFVPNSTISLFGKTSPFYPLMISNFNSNNLVSIYASGDSKGIQLYIKNLDHTGIYNFDTSNFNPYRFDTTRNYCVLGLDDPEWAVQYYFSVGYSTSGKVEITELSDDKKRIKGNFQGTVYKINSLTREINLSDSLVISKGKFNINRETLRQKM